MAIWPTILAARPRIAVARELGTTIDIGGAVTHEGDVHQPVFLKNAFVSSVTIRRTVNFARARPIIEIAGQLTLFFDWHRSRKYNSLSLAGMRYFPWRARDSGADRFYFAIAGGRKARSRGVSEGFAFFVDATLSGLGSELDNR